MDFVSEILKNYEMSIKITVPIVLVGNKEVFILPDGDGVIMTIP